jgi:predicted DNA-binding transcriptional regulator AlpA
MSQTVTPNDLCKALGIGDELERVMRNWHERHAAGGDLDRVISLAEWAKLACISPRTARDVIARGDGPKVVQLSNKRIGIRVCDHREWLAARTRNSTAG